MAGSAFRVGSFTSHAREITYKLPLEGGVQRFSSAPTSRPALSSCAAIGNPGVARLSTASATYPSAARWEVQPTSPVSPQIVTRTQAGTLEHQLSPRSNLLPPRVVPMRQFSTGQRDIPLGQSSRSPVRAVIKAPPTVHPQLAGPTLAQSCRPGWSVGASPSPASPLMTTTIASPRSPAICLNSPPRISGSQSDEIWQPAHTPPFCFSTPTGAKRTTSADKKHVSQSPALCLNSPQVVNDAISGEIKKLAHSAALCLNAPQATHVAISGEARQLLPSPVNSLPGINAAISGEVRQVPPSTASFSNSPPGVNGTISSENRQPEHSPAICLRSTTGVVGHHSGEIRQPVHSPAFGMRSLPVTTAAISDEIQELVQASTSCTSSPGAISGETGATIDIEGSQAGFSPSQHVPNIGIELEVAEARMDFAKLRSAINHQLGAWSRHELNVADLCTKFGPSRLCVHNIHIDDRGAEPQKPCDLDLKALISKVTAHHEQLSKAIGSQAL